MRTALVCACGALAFLAAGCSAMRGDVPAFPQYAASDAMPAARIAAAVKFEGEETYRVKRVAETLGCRIYAIHTRGEIQSYTLPKWDQVFYVVSGTCVAEVNGERDVVGPGSVVVVARGEAVRFLRVAERDKEPILLLQSLTPGDAPREVIQKALEPAPAKAKTGDGPAAEKKAVAPDAKPAPAIKPAGKP